MIVLPEVQLKLIVEYCLQFVTNNYKQKIDKKKTYLYAIFGESSLGDYSYFENAVAIFTRDKSHPRNIETHLFLNPNRFSLPTIHISLPGESVGPHGIGFDRQINTPLNSDSLQDTTNTRAFNSRFNLVFTSDNTGETLILYNVIRACLIGNVELLALNGIQNPSFSGADILLNQEIDPVTYARALQIDCFYEIQAPSFKEYEVLHDVEFKGYLASDLEINNLNN